MTDRHTPFWNKRSSDSDDEDAPKDSKKEERGGPFYSSYDDDDYEYEDINDIDSDSSSRGSASSRYGAGSSTSSRYGREDDDDDLDDDASSYGRSTSSRYGSGTSRSTTSRYGTGSSQDSSPPSRYGTASSTPSRYGTSSQDSSSSSRYGAGSSTPSRYGTSSQDSSTTPSRYGSGTSSTSSRYGSTADSSSTAAGQKRRGLSLPGRGGRESSSGSRDRSTTRAGAATDKKAVSGGGLGGRLSGLGGGLSKIRKRLPGGGDEKGSSPSTSTRASTTSRYGTSPASSQPSTSSYGSRASQTRNLGRRGGDRSTRDSLGSSRTAEKKSRFNISLPFGRDRGEKASRTQSQPSAPRGVRRAKPLPKSAKRPRIKNEGIALDLKLDIAGWALVILAAIIFFGAISSTQGDLSRTLLRLIYQLVGVGWAAVPVALGGAGIWLIWRHFGDRAPEADYVKIVGWVITYLGALATAHFIHLLSQPVQTLDQLQAFSDLAAETGNGGGWVGGLIYMTLIRALGDIGTFCMLVGWWGIGIIVATDLSIADIIGFVDRISKRVITRYSVVRAERAAARRALAASQPQIDKLLEGEAAVSSAALQETAGSKKALPEPEVTPAGRLQQMPLIRRRGRDAAEIDATAEEPAETTASSENKPSIGSTTTASSTPVVSNRASTTRVISRPAADEPAPSPTTPDSTASVRASTASTPPPASMSAAAGNADDEKTSEGPVTLKPGLMRVRRPQYEENTPKPTSPLALDDDTPDEPAAVTTGTTAEASSQASDLLLGGARTRTPAEIRSGLTPAPRPAEKVQPVSPITPEPDDEEPDKEESPDEDLSFMRPAQPRNPDLAQRRMSLRQRGAGLSPAERAALEGKFAKPSVNDKPDDEDEQEDDEVLANEPVYEPLPDSPLADDDLPVIEIDAANADDEDEEDEEFDDDEVIIDMPRVTSAPSRVFASLDDMDENEDDDFEDEIVDLDEDEEDEDLFLFDDERGETDDDMTDMEEEEDEEDEDEDDSFDYLPSRPSTVAPSRAFESRPIRQAAPEQPAPTPAPAPRYTPPTPARPTSMARSAPVARTIFPEPTESEQWIVPDFREILDPVAEQNINDDVLLDRARIIEDTLSSFGAPGKVVEVNPGPVITQFGVEPDYIESRGGKRTRVKVQAIARLADDLALSLAARSIRIEAPVPGKGFVGIEVPNAETALVSLRDIMDSPEFEAIDSWLRIGLGQSVDGAPVSADLTAMPHLLIAGTTGSGKSVLVNALITCLLLQNTPDTLRFIMVDPKRVELTGYNGIPHLVAPVVVDLERIVGVLKWVTREMDDRYKKFNERGARNIANYNSMLGPDEKPLPYLVIVVDELADLMMLAPDETERVLTRLAQMSRATGIHLIISTQRPSVDIITGLIKANFPARVAFAVASSVDSRVILDQPGAEKLLGRGDMLFQAPDAAAPSRLQGVFVSDTELNRLVNHWKGTRVVESRSSTTHVSPPPRLDSSSPGLGSSRSNLSRPSVGIEPIRSRGEKYGAPEQRPTTGSSTNFWDEVAPKPDKRYSSDDVDELYDEAVAVVRRLKKASVSLLQRQLRIGYTRAARLIDVMEERNVVGPPTSGSKPRKVIGYTDEEVVIDMDTYSGDD